MVLENPATVVRDTVELNFLGDGLSVLLTIDDWPFTPRAATWKSGNCSLLTSFPDCAADWLHRYNTLLVPF